MTPKQMQSGHVLATLAAAGAVDISAFMPERSGPVHPVEASPEQLAAYRDERRARKAAAWARRNRKAAP